MDGARLGYPLDWTNESLTTKKVTKKAFLLLRLEMLIDFHLINNESVPLSLQILNANKGARL